MPGACGADEFFQYLLVESIMKSQRICISLAPELIRFMDRYALMHGGMSRSQAVSDALTLMQGRDASTLEAAYLASSSADRRMDQAMTGVAGDGLEDIRW